MTLDVFECSQLFSIVFRCPRDVFRCSQLFSDVLRIPSIDHRYCIEIFRFVQHVLSSDVLRCSQMFSDDHRCFWIFSRYSINVHLIFSRYSQDVCRIFQGGFKDAPMGLVGLVEFDDPFKQKYGR